MSAYFIAKDDCVHRELFPGVDLFVTWGSGLMLSLVEFQPAAVVEEHSHPHEQMGMILDGRAEFFVGDEHRVLGPGDFYRIPGGIRHRVVALDAPVRAIDVFHPPREEYQR